MLRPVLLELLVFLSHLLELPLAHALHPAEGIAVQVVEDARLRLFPVLLRHPRRVQRAVSAFGGSWLLESRARPEGLPARG